jgi:hypothetical protein
MKQPAIARLDRCTGRGSQNSRGERGVTIALVALSIVAIMAMAALSIDVVTLYLANAEAQRSADTAALAAARILSLSGMTGDPQNAATGTAASALALQVAQAVANQNVVAGAVPNSVTVSFNAAPLFGVNPIVTVHVSRTNLPTFFARIWGNRSSTVSATANAEAYNPSNSATYAGSMVPVQPRCVKPWIIPNLDQQTGSTIVGTADGSITKPGIQLNWSGGGLIIGERLTLTPFCSSANCFNAQGKHLTAGTYIPALIQPLPVPVAIPSCATSDPYQEAIAGCDQTTVYSCGAPNGITATADLTFNPGNTPGNGDTSTAAQCLIRQPGQDIIDPGSYPFRILAGDTNPLIAAGINSGTAITASNSIVTIPIMDNTNPVITGGYPSVTIVGYLQAFIERVDGAGNPVVTIINVSGCSNSAGAQSGVTGTSPVPVRLINYP